MPPLAPNVVLLIGNDPALAASQERILAREGLRVIWFDDPTQALEHAGKGIGRLAIFNHDDDFDVAELAGTLGSMRPNLPRLILSSRASRDTSDQRLIENSDVLLHLPLTFGEFLDSATQLLHPKRSREHRPATQMPHKGALSEAAFEDILFCAFQHRFSGQIVVEHGHMRKVIFLLSGFPVGASSNIPTEALGNMLLQRGFIDDGALRRALEALQHTRQSIGQLLIKQRSITESILQEVLNEQVRERILACFELKEGSFEVFQSAEPPPSRSLFTQNPVSLIQLGITRFRDPNGIIAEVTANSTSYIVPTHNFSRLVPYLNLGSTRQEMLEIVDGRHRLSALRQRWRGNEPAFLHFFKTLLTAQLIFLSPTPIPSRAAPIESILLPPQTLEPLMKPRAARSHGRRPELRSGTFQGLLGVPSLNLLLALSDDQLKALNHFELFGLHPNATPFQIHTQVRNLLLYLNTLQPSMMQAAHRSHFAPLQKHLTHAASILLDTDAREHYRSSLAPHSGEQLIIARQLLQRGQHEDATDMLEQMEAGDPANPVIATLLALGIYRRDGVRDRVGLARAQALLARAIALDEHNADAYHVLGCIEHDLDNPEQAQVAWLRALAIDPGHAETRAALAR